MLNGEEKCPTCLAPVSGGPVQFEQGQPPAMNQPEQAAQAAENPAPGTVADRYTVQSQPWQPSAPAANAGTDHFAMMGQGQAPPLVQPVRMGQGYVGGAYGQMPQQPYVQPVAGQPVAPQPGYNGQQPYQPYGGQAGMPMQAAPGANPYGAPAPYGYPAVPYAAQQPVAGKKRRMAASVIFLLFGIVMGLVTGFVIAVGAVAVLKAAHEFYYEQNLSPFIALGLLFVACILMIVAGAKCRKKNVRMIAILSFVFTAVGFVVVMFLDPPAVVVGMYAVVGAGALVGTVLTLAAPELKEN